MTDQRLHLLRQKSNARYDRREYNIAGTGTDKIKEGNSICDTSSKREELLTTKGFMYHAKNQHKIR